MVLRIRHMLGWSIDVHGMESEKEGTENAYIKPADSNPRELSNDETSKTKPLQSSVLVGLAATMLFVCWYL